MSRRKIRDGVIPDLPIFPEALHFVQRGEALTEIRRDEDVVEQVLVPGLGGEKAPFFEELDFLQIVAFRVGAREVF